MEYSNNNINEEFEFKNLSLKMNDKKHRLGFIRKVYGILSVQLLINTIFIILSKSSLSYVNYISSNFWLFFVCFAVYFVVIYSLYYSRDLARKVWLLGSFKLYSFVCVYFGI